MTGAPQGPRRRLDEDRRRAQIITAAVEEVAASGYEGATLTRVAARAGVSKGLLWHYFTGKDDLMAATAESTLRRITDAVAAGLDLAAPVPDVIRAALRRAADLSATTELIALDRIVHNLRGPDGAPRLTLDAYEEVYAGQETLFRRGQAEGSLRGFDTRVMAVTYQGAVDMMIAYLTAHPEADRHAYADALAEILLSGIARA
ncbi:TetR/AcrR family transcriptional regulator [Glycomyces terrestris]|uniref:TetR/AcrR family transcriptional regulator n=1 Tax=Glycomyces terrestris TaxID=2493553 RepID=UPI00131555C6|nr:TetR/AcrR family transcriptional regulator [Glycomyces terrestris]